MCYASVQISDNLRFLRVDTFTFRYESVNYWATVETIGDLPRHEGRPELGIAAHFGLSSTRLVYRRASAHAEYCS